MAGKKKKPTDQLVPRTKDSSKLEAVARPMPSFDEITGGMLNEVTSAISDYQRQYIGVYGQLAEKPGDAIFINWDPVQREETYKRWAQFNLYWYLEKDPQIRAILSAAIVNVVSRPWRIKPYLKGTEKKPSVTNQAQADFIQSMFESMDSFPQHLYDLMDALPKGFSFSEFIWQLKDGFWTIEKLMNRPQRRIQFDAVTRQPRVRTLTNPFYGDRVEAGKYIVHRCSSNWEDPFGDAVDQSLYWMWLFKRQVWGYYLRHLDTGASSSPIIEVPQNAGDKQKAEALKVAEMIHNGSFGYLPANFKLLWAESNKTGEISEAFETCIRLTDDQMTKCVKGQLLTTEGASSSGSGSRSMGKIHQETEDSYDVFRARGLAASINKYLVYYGITYNFSSIQGFPRFTFDVEEEENLVDASVVLVNLAKALPDYDVDIDQINEKFNYNFVKKPKTETPPPVVSDPANLEPDTEGVTA